MSAIRTETCTDETCTDETRTDETRTDGTYQDGGRSLRSLARDLLPQRPTSNVLGLTAMMWLASAGLHSVIFLFSDTSWSGSVSWRKPIVFSLSIALMLWGFGWVLDRQPDRRRLAWPLAIGFSVASTGEVGLVLFQQWRGRPSHFNTFAGGDAAVFAAMGMLVAVMSLALVGLLIWSAIERPKHGLDRIAALAGLILIMSGLGVGQWLISLGSQYAEQFDRVPETVINGEAGVAKFPHAVAFHGLQVFMATAALLGRSSVPKPKAIRTMWMIVAAYAGVLVFSALQSFGGRAPFDLDVGSGALLALSTVTLLGGLGAALRWWLMTPAATPRQASAPQTTTF